MRNFLALTLFLVSSYAVAQDIFIFNQGGVLDYSIKLSDIVPGHSARQVSQGFLLGVAQSKRQDLDMNKPVEEIFKDTIENNKKESDLLQKSEVDLANKFNNLDDGFGTLSSEDSKDEDAIKEFVIRWDAFDQCAKVHLPRLKQSIYLKNKIATDPKAKEKYEIVKSLVWDQSSNGGLVCGALLGPHLKWTIEDEVTNVKVLSALLSASKDYEKKHLFETLLGGYEQRAPEDSRILFVYFWAKISFLSVMQQGPLPSHFRMVQEFKDKPETIHSEMILNGEVVNIETKMNYNDLKKQMSAGRQFVGNLGIQYEK